MPRKAARVTETELAIMDAIWERGPISVREIVESLYSEHTPSLHATVKSLLDRLTEKGLVTCDGSRFAHRFSASVDRETLVAALFWRHPIVWRARQRMLTAWELCSGALALGGSAGTRHGYEKTLYRAAREVFCDGDGRQVWSKSVTEREI